MDIKKIVIGLIIVCFFVSAGANVWFSFLLTKYADIQQTQKQGEKVLAFRNMFTESVLLSNKEVDFETRLALENAVRDISDKEIFDQWQRFTNAKDNTDVQKQVGLLLDILMSKIQ